MSLCKARRCETWLIDRSSPEPLMAHDNCRALTLDSWTRLLECHQEAVHSQPCISFVSPLYHSQCCRCMYGWGVFVWSFWYRTWYHGRLHPRLPVTQHTGRTQSRARLRSLCRPLSTSSPPSQVVRWRCGHLAERVGEAKNPGPEQGPEDPFWLVLENEDGEPCNLRRSRVHSRNTWRWQAPPVKKHDPRRASVDRKDPVDALRNWQTRWAHTLNEPSRLTLEEACAAAPAAPPLPSQTRLPTIEEEPESVPAHDEAGEPEETNQFTVPDHDTMTRIAAMPAHELLHGPAPTQRRLPAPSRMVLHEALAQLLLHAETSESDEGRQAALVMLMLSPRLLWPEPAKPPGQKRQPYARQRVIRQRLQLLYQGDWMRLIRESNAGQVQQKPPAGAGADDPDQHLLHSLKRAANRGRLGQSWKKLTGPGLRPWNEHTIDEIRKKWAPRDSPPERTSALELQHLHATFTNASVQKALTGLSQGACPDVLGWTHETLRCLHRQSPNFALVRRCLMQLYMCSAEARPWELYNCSKMIPLAKGNGPSVRPIAVPTVWHKVASSSLTKLLMPEFQAATAGTQHGIGLKNGAGVLVERIRTLMRDSPNQAIAQIDISNAFGCIDRHAASRVLAHHTHSAARVLSRWLTSTQWATCQRSTTEYVLSAHEGRYSSGRPCISGAVHSHIADGYRRHNAIA